MFDRKMVQGLVGDGLYHVVFEVANVVRCYDCGNEIREARYRSVDGQILEVSDSVVHIKRLDGPELMIELGRVIRIENYEPSGMPAYQTNHGKRGSGG